LIKLHLSIFFFCNSHFLFYLGYLCLTKVTKNFFLAVLGVELRASFLHAVTLPLDPHPQPFFALVILETGPCFLTRANLDLDPPILVLLEEAGMTSVPSLHPAFPVEMGSYRLVFCLVWSGIEIPLTSTSRLACDDSWAIQPSYWLRWGLVNYLLLLALNYNPPHLNFPSS
jgi:hypothetical protein